MGRSDVHWVASWGESGWAAHAGHGWSVESPALVNIALFWPLVPPRGWGWGQTPCSHCSRALAQALRGVASESQPQGDERGLDLIDFQILAMT